MVGCVGFQPVQNPVCPQEDSFICTQSAKYNIQPEQVYGYLYDAAAIATITDVMDLETVCAYEQSVADWYEAMAPLTYDAFIKGMILTATDMEPIKAALLIRIINKHLWVYGSPALISPADDAIIRKAHVAFRDDMLCYE